MYRVDIIKDEKRWTDTVGVASSPDGITAVAIGLLAEAAVETTPTPGSRFVAEVFDETDRLVVKAELLISA
jgi:hypothetical protein